ncbi:hypothetical protein CEUSTIGMA_g9664.t1 [Chlamydomonas eustigma]|uniref:Iron hydrogenase large subunit C-terminal domain-containing protein n=1 Tax=Chlamydomonas eustigma TaxID=1157962 RepID=A0A250XGT6_9CHLO|nr:hypothetical protein CEUSTIGMA_g9664.t1 [Chlamydomonas eustigma]|eukprot:GAX82236.1 hypothetical protein CEUSTIGMA_g9664.t1 [Chlamydomonas eustigma]
MAQFSGAVRIADLNDYIAPSQACVVALNSSKAMVPAEEVGQVSFQSSTSKQEKLGASQDSGSKPHWTQAQAAVPGQAVKVTLHDCLACSGCVTSAETVLLESQSGQEVMKKLREAAEAQVGSASAPVVIVSLAPQSVAALTALYNMSPTEAYARLSSWFYGHGATAVLDICDSRDLSLIETAHEFIDRYRRSHECTTSTPTSGNLSPSLIGKGLLPMLASACPGWVCYAEKTHGEFVLPYISSTKSPQAMMGSLVKRLLAGRLGCSDVHLSRLFHVTVMPCYDKKLEASREELTVHEGKVPEVDCCLTTSEVHKLLSEDGINHLDQIPLHPKSESAKALAAWLQGALHVNDKLTRCSAEEASSHMCDSSSNCGCTYQGASTAQPMDVDSVNGDALLQAGRMFESPGAGGSGGYMEFVFRCAAKQLFGIDVPPGPLKMASVRNADFQEVILQSPADGSTLLRFALAYGFRNIQSLMRKIKIKKCEYHYVEIMACPSGCLNGGGQLPASKGETAAQLLQSLEEAYFHMDNIKRPSPQDSSDVKYIYNDCLKAMPLSQSAVDIFHTSYKKRERTVGVIASDW